MKNENDVKEWMRFADMDVLSANAKTAISAKLFAQSC